MSWHRLTGFGPGRISHGITASGRHCPESRGVSENELSYKQYSNKDKALKKSISINYLHILGVLKSEMNRFNGMSSVRILDLGCGNGHLIAYLYENLQASFPEISLSIWGHDVSDYEASAEGYMKNTQEFLSAKYPHIPWEKHIRAISSKDKWPYADDFFDIIITNQVIEHIEDHNFFFSEVYRTLHERGYSVNIFPLIHSSLEGHLRLPFVHKIRNFDYLLGAIKLLSYLGLGIFKRLKKEKGFTLDCFAEQYADYLRNCTNYISDDQAFGLAKKNHLRISFRYTTEYYSQKIRSLFRMQLKTSYKIKRNILKDIILVFILRYIASITMFLEKKDSYLNMAESYDSNKAVQNSHDARPLLAQNMGCR
jgi:SAM-dependent methyltransferase